MSITRRDFIKDSAKKAVAIAISAKALDSLCLDTAPADKGSESELKESMFYSKVDSVKIQCLLEPRGCIVNNWERGFCGVKENRDGKYYTLVFSNPSAVYFEPIESDHFYHILPGRQFLGIGTAGCNLGCKFCETWHLSQVRPEETETQKLSPEDAVKLAIDKECRIIDFTYNDPVICYEYALETMKLAREKNLITLCHTAGYIHDEPLEALLKYVNAVNVDLKAFTEKYYSSICGVDLEKVLQTLKIVKQHTFLEITNLIVPGYNDDKQEITDMVSWIIDNLGDSVPLHFSRFFPNYQLMNLPATPEETLEMAYDISQSRGVRYVYIDNVPGNDHGSTYCHNCRSKLIQRDASEVKMLELGKDGVCKKCGQLIPGIWT